MVYTTKRYSEAFKKQVLDDIETGPMSLSQAARSYEIGTCTTINNWLRQRGKDHLVPKVVRVETIDDRERIKALLAEKQRLESALAQSQLKVMALEELI